jgi:hypothetical protein
VLLGIGEAGLERAHVELDGLDLLAELLLERVLHLREIDVQQLRQNPVVDHVLDEPPELGVLADFADDPVERRRIEDQIVSQATELERFVVEHGRARFERQHVFLRRLRVHRNEEIDLFLPTDISVLVGADRVPRR